MLNWQKIAANAGVAFFTTLAGSSLMLKLSWETAGISIVTAVITGGLACCIELSRELGDNSHALVI